METFPSVKGLHNPASEILHAFPETGPLGRPIFDEPLQRGILAWYPEEDLSSENWPCSVELEDQDSAIFKTDVEPLLECLQDPEDSAGPDLYPSAAFLDWGGLADVEPADLPAHAPDIVIDDGDVECAVSLRSSLPEVVKECLRSLATGFVCHLVGFGLLVSGPSPLQNGLGGISPRPICVRLPASCEIDTPDIPSRASIDAPGSVASLARRHSLPEEQKPREESKKEPLPEVEPKKPAERPEHAPRPAEEKPAKAPIAAREKTPPDVSLRDPFPNDSPNLHDSVASAPSVATPERKGALQAGLEAETYRDTIFSAIHRAAYYPRAALKKMSYGKVIVSFTIKKDGSLANVSIVGHAESETLDEAALKIVQQASSHFPPIPDALKRDQVTYVIPLIFKKKG